MFTCCSCKCDHTPEHQLGDPISDNDRLGIDEIEPETSIICEQISHASRVAELNKEHLDEKEVNKNSSNWFRRRQVRSEMMKANNNQTIEYQSIMEHNFSTDLEQRLQLAQVDSKFILLLNGKYTEAQTPFNDVVNTDSGQIDGHLCSSTNQLSSSLTHVNDNNKNNTKQNNNQCHQRQKQVNPSYENADHQQNQLTLSFNQSRNYANLPMMKSSSSVIKQQFRKHSNDNQEIVVTTKRRRASQESNIKQTSSNLINTTSPIMPSLRSISASILSSSMGIKKTILAPAPARTHQSNPYFVLSAIMMILILSLDFSPLTISFIPKNRAQPINFVSALLAASSQRFEAQPEREYLVPSGHEVRLRCLVRERQGECLWLRNGKAVGNIARKYRFERQPEDGDCSMLIKNASVQLDDGLWQCQVTPSELDQETLQSRELKLIVLVPPEMPQIKNTTAPASSSINSNTNQFNPQRVQANSWPKLVLEESKVKHVLCEMRGGNPEPRIEWLLDGRNVSREAMTQSTGGGGQSGQASSRLTQSRLKLADVRRSMNGKNLTCVGIHQTGNQSASAELDVQYLPTVSVVQREYSIVEGSPLSISCQVDANPPPNLINWRLVNDNANGLATSNASPSRAQHNYHSAAFTSAAGHSPSAAALSQSSSSISLPTRPGPILEFERISRDLNQNVFECLAQNAYGISLPADVKLNVLYAPYLVNTSNSESVPVGSDAQLACIFDGNPEPEIKWFYTDPLSRLASASQLSEPNSIQSSWAGNGGQAQLNNKHNQQSSPSSALINGSSSAGSSRSQQFLNIKNVTYRNEGDYHCEARNQINGVYYGVRSSNIILDVFGEPQFLIKSPVVARAIRGAKSEISAIFCSDPAPNKVFWQFGSIRLEVRLNNTLQGDASSQQQQQTRPSIASLLLSQLGGGSTTNSGSATTSNAGSPSGGSQQQKSSPNSQHQQQVQAAIHQRFQVHPLQPLQRRDSAFSKSQTCFEAKLSLLDPELTDERDYMITVQNERGHQTATVKLQVSSPLSPMLIISSGLVTICGFFLLSIVLLFFVRTRQAVLLGGASGGGTTNGTTGNGLNGQVNGADGTKQSSSQSKKQAKLSKSLSNGDANGNGQTTIMNSSVEHLANGNGNVYLHHPDQQSNGNVNGIGNGELTGQTNGVGSGHANQASNLNSLHHHSSISIMSSSDQLSIGDNINGHQNNHTLLSENNNQHGQKVNNNNKQQQASISSSSEVSSHASANDQRQLLAGGGGGSTAAAAHGGACSPGMSSIGSQLSSPGSSRSSGETMLDTHTNIDFNLQSSTLASSNSMSSGASSTIMRSAYLHQQIIHNNPDDSLLTSLSNNVQSINETYKVENDANIGNNNNNNANRSYGENEEINYNRSRVLMNDLQADHDRQHVGDDQNEEQSQVNENSGSTYRAAESVLRGVSNLSGPGQSMGHHHMMMMQQQQNNSQKYNDKNAIIYANIDCSHEVALANLMSSGPTSATSSSFATIISNDNNTTNGQQQSSEQQQAGCRVSGGPRSKVGATIAMMNSLAAQSSGQIAPNNTIGATTTTIGALNGAMRQHQFNNLQNKQQQNGGSINQVLPIANRKQGPPKPPKPMIQQASRFYQQAAAVAAAASSTAPNSSSAPATVASGHNGFNRNGSSQLGTPTRDELAAEYSRLAFPERAEL